MHEKEKLAEAKYFYQRIFEEKSNIEHFKYNLSAFLSSARSVFQYTLEEAKNKPNGQVWYDNHMASNPVFAFFKDKRDINIHIEPIRPRVQHNITITETIRVSESVSIVIKDKEGNIKGTDDSPDEPESNSELPGSSIISETTYRFNDWCGNENVLTLCQTYLQQLEDFISEGIVQNFISG